MRMGNNIKINAPRISLFINRDYTEIEIEDADSGALIKIKLTPEQLSSALSRLAYTPCESMEIIGIERFGKKMEYKDFTFEMPEKVEWVKLKETAIKLADENCPEGWTADHSFSSQNSFFKAKDGKNMAGTYIRRWV
jgi:hypothetical protein